MRGVGQQRFLRLQQGIARLHQRFNLLRRMVETIGQKADLVVARHRHPHTQIAIAPFLHTVLQRLQTARQTPNNGVGRQCHGNTNQSQCPPKPKGCAPTGQRGAWQVDMDDLAILHAHVKLRAGAKFTAHFATGFIPFTSLGGPSIWRTFPRRRWRSGPGLLRWRHDPAWSRRRAAQARASMADDFSRLVACNDLTQGRFRRHAPSPTHQQR